MKDVDKVTPLSQKIAASLLKGEYPIVLDKFRTLTEEDKKCILLDISNRKKREERIQLKSKLCKQKAWKTITGTEMQDPS